MHFFFSSRRRHTRYIGDWSSDVCSSDLNVYRDTKRHVDVVRRAERRQAGGEPDNIDVTVGVAIDVAAEGGAGGDRKRGGYRKGEEARGVRNNSERKEKKREGGRRMHGS